METFPLHLFSTNPKKKRKVWFCFYDRYYSWKVKAASLSIRISTYLHMYYDCSHCCIGSIRVESLYIISLPLNPSTSLWLLESFFLSKVLVQLSLVVEFNVRQCFKAIRVFALRDISGRLFLAHSQRRNTQNCLMFYTEAARERRHKVNTCRMSM